MFCKFEILGKVLLKPFDTDLFELAEDVAIKCFSEKYGVLTIRIKAGFKTDLASIPLWAQIVTGLRSRGNPYWTAAMVCHDFAYASQSHLHSFSKDFVDDLLLEMILTLPTGVSDFKASCIYEAVHWLGDNAWKNFDEYDVETAEKGLGSMGWSDK